MGSLSPVRADQSYMAEVSQKQLLLVSHIEVLHSAESDDNAGLGLSRGKFQVVLAMALQGIQLPVHNTGTPNMAMRM